MWHSLIVAMATVRQANASTTARLTIGECVLESTAGRNQIVVSGDCEFVDAQGNQLYASATDLESVKSEVRRAITSLGGQIAFRNDPPASPPPASPPPACQHGLTASDPISGPSEYSTTPGECPSRVLYYSIGNYDSGNVFSAYTDCSLTTYNSGGGQDGAGSTQVPMPSCIVMLYHRHFDAASWSDSYSAPNIMPHHLMKATHPAHDGAEIGYNKGYVLKDQGTLMSAMCSSSEASTSQIFVGQYDFETGTELASPNQHLNYIRFPGQLSSGSSNIDGPAFVALFNEFKNPDTSSESFQICFDGGYCRNPFYQTGHHTGGGVVQLGAHHGGGPPNGGNREVCFEYAVDRSPSATDTSHTWAVWGDCQYTCSSSCFARESGRGSGNRIGFVGVAGC